MTVAPGHLGELPGRHERGDRAGRHRSPLGIDDEAAIGVAVEGQPEVGALGHDARLQVDKVGRLERVGLVVRERPVQLEVHIDDRERQRGQDGAAEHGGGR